MRLEDLWKITGHKSISQMTLPEAIEHIKAVRESRLITKASDRKRTEKDTEEKPPRERKARAPREPKSSKQLDISKLSPEEALKLLNELRNL